jgi:LDH2 family malate/lactate/ureidoglycolate dehydrogenase
MPVIAAEPLRRLTTAIFQAAGATRENADRVAEALVESNLVGHDSHGVIRIPSYIQAIRQGHIQPAATPTILRETPTAALVSGNWTFGHVAAKFGTEVAVAKARAQGLAAVGIVQCNHIGRLGEYPTMAARQGVIALVTAGGSLASGVRGPAAPYGGRGRALGTNPIAVGVPGGDFPPLLLDFATTAVAGGKIMVARARRQPLPPGAILDPEGNPSTDPEDFYRGGVMLPFGGHKGYALSMVVELLSGPLTGADAHAATGRTSGTFILAIDAGLFRPLAEFVSVADRVYRQVKETPPAPGFEEVLLPGEPEWRTRARRLAEGIPIEEATWSAIVQVARDLGIDAEAFRDAPA